MAAGGVEVGAFEGGGEVAGAGVAAFVGNLVEVEGGLGEEAEGEVVLVFAPDGGGGLAEVCAEAVFESAAADAGVAGEGVDVGGGVEVLGDVAEGFADDGVGGVAPGGAGADLDGLGGEARGDFGGACAGGEGEEGVEGGVADLVEGVGDGGEGDGAEEGVGGVVAGADDGEVLGDGDVGGERGGGKGAGVVVGGAVGAGAGGEGVGREGLRDCGEDGDVGLLCGAEEAFAAEAGAVAGFVVEAEEGGAAGLDEVAGGETADVLFVGDDAGDAADAAEGRGVDEGDGAGEGFEPAVADEGADGAVEAVLGEEAGE